MGTLFKFELGDVVASKADKSIEGKIVARLNMASGNRYEFQSADGSCVNRDERDLALAERRPPWLKKGVKVRWLGEGRHDVYVVTLDGKDGHRDEGHSSALSISTSGQASTPAISPRWNS